MTQRAFHSKTRTMRLVLTLLVACFGFQPVFASSPAPLQKGLVRMSVVETSAEKGQKIPGHYPDWYRVLMTGWLAHEPYSEIKMKSPQCDARKLEKLFRDPRVKDLKFQAAVMRRHLRTCQSEIEKPFKTGLRHTFDSLRLAYQTRENKLFRHVLFDLPQGVKVRGLLGLKNDQRPRPLVILRLGIFSSVEEFMAERSFVIQLFDQSPFHLLILENSTSGDFIQNNLRLSLGGFDEGAQNILIANFLRSPRSPLAGRIVSQHFVGISLGGHGVLFAALLNNEKNPSFDSAMLFCPVIDLKKTFENLQSNPLKAPFINYWASDRLSALQQRSMTTFSTFKFLPEALDFLKTHYQGPLMGNLSILKGFDSGSEFWQLNSFHTRLKDLKTPLLSIITSRDQLVPKELNSQTVKSAQFQIVEFPEGEHCSLASAYDWQTILAILKGHILSQSPGFKTQEVEIPLGQAKISHENLSLEVQRIPQSPHLVKIRLEGVLPALEVHLAISQFGFGFPQKPLSESEFQLLRRGILGMVHVVPRNKHLSLIWEL